MARIPMDPGQALRDTLVGVTTNWPMAKKDRVLLRELADSAVGKIARLRYRVRLGQVVRNAITERRSRRVVIPATIFYFTIITITVLIARWVYQIAFGLILDVSSPEELQAEGNAYLFILSVFFFFVFVNTAKYQWKQSRRRAQPKLNVAVARLALALDAWIGNPTLPKYQSDCVERLEKCAKLAERQLIAYRLGSDKRTEAVAAEVAVGIAARFREYKIWVMMPIATTPDDLTEAIAKALSDTARGRWYELPKAPIVVDRRANLISKIALAVSAILIVAGLVYIAIRQAEFGAAGTIIASVGALVLVFVLGKLGISFETLQQASAAAKSVEQRLSSSSTAES